ncbi:MAG: PQQ-binding-like beta-propeller repeat protein [Planctomycetes bacterium]|nr:PQQ-binding-like beta-propeller repeat protein [Planctomycetota bacterium]
MCACAAPAPPTPRRAIGHPVLTQGNGALSLLTAAGDVAWQMPWGGIHDIHLLPSDNVMVQRGASAVVEIDRATRQVVWEYDAASSNGNAGRPVEVHAFQPLPDGTVMIAESGPARILEVGRDGKVIANTPLTVDRPHPHTDTRLVRKIAADRYLVCHEGDGVVREYERGTGRVLWDYDVPLFGRQPRGGHGPEAFGDKCFCALRLANGNTLIATGNGHGVLEVSPAREIVWRLDQHDLPGVTLAWVTTLDVLDNGNYLVGNCHAGPGQPVLIELEPRTKAVVWRLDAFDRLGNSVSNSVVVDGSSALR